MALPPLLQVEPNLNLQPFQRLHHIQSVVMLKEHHVSGKIQRHFLELHTRMEYQITAMHVVQSTSKSYLCASVASCTCMRCFSDRRGGADRYLDGWIWWSWACCATALRGPTAPARQSEHDDSDDWPSPPLTGRGRWASCGMQC